jgi:hypothetical protein
VTENCSAPGGRKIPRKIAAGLPADNHAFIVPEKNYGCSIGLARLFVWTSERARPNSHAAWVSIRARYYQPCVAFLKHRLLIVPIRGSSCSTIVVIFIPIAIGTGHHSSKGSDTCRGKRNDFKN